MATFHHPNVPHMNRVNPNGMHRRRSIRGNAGHGEASGSGGAQVAHTLTACTRCRQRKTRCDPGLPRCGPCERTNSVCEYYDSNKGHNVNRNYVVYLQHKARELEEELERVENEDIAEDPEAMMRAATVKVHEAKESKFLGPSSGIAITRLVMQLAKQFTDSRSIKEIVPEYRARQIKDLYLEEQAKPTSKTYPLISDVPANELPNRDLMNYILQLYKLKVQPMYPALHEPTLDQDIETVYQNDGQATSFQHFECRMVIAISLQKMNTEYAGLADSYYLAALKHLEHVIKPMDLKTLQCFALMAEYSLLTPTRTAIYYIIGIAVRLAQALGINEEKTVVRKDDYLETDMRRRLFYCIIVMDFGLAHSLGRPAMLATNYDHVDVAWFETCDDKHITREGIDPAAERPTLKKWVAVHFFKMRMLQLEIRRKLYLRKRPEPRSDSDKWFIDMEAKLIAWRDAAPGADEGFGLDKAWFIGRYNTMVVFLFRPSPQVPRPSLQAALKCYEACEYNIYMHRKQIATKNVDLTWIFTQSIFMAINTMLWSLSYEEVRKKYDRQSVEGHLETAMDAIQLASERWPGVASAVQLYQNLIAAILKIYDKDGDVPISAATPSDMASPNGGFPDTIRSRTTSPATVASSSVATPPVGAPFGYMQHQAVRKVDYPPPMQYQGEMHPPAQTPPPRPTPPVASASTYQPQAGPSNNTPQLQRMHSDSSSHQQTPQPQFYDPYSQYNHLPEFTGELTVPGWTMAQQQQPQFAQAPMQSHFDNFLNPVFDPNNQAYPFPQTVESNYGNEEWEQNWDMDAGNFGVGLNEDQQQELMQRFQTDGMEDIQSIIQSSLAQMTPKALQEPMF